MDRLQIRVGISGLFVVLAWSGAVFAGYPAAGRCDRVYQEIIDVNRLQDRFAEVKARIKDSKPQRLDLGEGRIIQYQIVKPENPDLPTYLLLPGVNRSLFLDDKAPTMIAFNGFGLATFNFSVQPLSVGMLKKAERPHFLDSEVGFAELAREAEAFSQYLAEQGIKNVIPVTLSYTGAISPLLKKSSLVVDVVPMTSWEATNPELAQYYNTLKAGEFWNPIFGPGITRAALDSAYRSQWVKKVDSFIEEYKLPAYRREEMVQGYIQMSRASETKDWDIKTVAKGPRRIMVLAGQETPSLLKHQLTTFQKMISERSESLLVMVLESGHIIPNDQPEAFAVLLQAIGTNRIPNEAGVILMDGEGKTRIVPREQTSGFIDHMLKDIE